ncbi:Tetratricopeptide repeat protein [Planctomycetales bacterium 10988]|nr:Tetratricopeptide repeat protein [Planctomycetales bacterium 10988]
MRGRLHFVAFLGMLCCGMVSLGCNGFRSQGMNSEGTRFYQQGNFQAANQRFLQAIQIDPENADGYYNLGATYHQLARQSQQAANYDLAEDYYNRCLDRNGDHVECYRALAVMLVERGRSEDANRLMQGWLQRSPTLADARVEYARLLEEFSEPDRSKQLLEEALLIDPRHPRALAALGNLYEKSGDPQQQIQALQLYERSLASNNLQPALAQRVASLRSSLGGFQFGTNTLPGNPNPNTRVVNTPPNAYPGRQ